MGLDRAQLRGSVFAVPVHLSALLARDRWFLPHHVVTRVVGLRRADVSSFALSGLLLFISSPAISTEPDVSPLIGGPRIDDDQKSALVRIADRCTGTPAPPRGRGSAPVTPGRRRVSRSRSDYGVRRPPLHGVVDGTRPRGLCAWQRRGSSADPIAAGTSSAPSRRARQRFWWGVAAQAPMRRRVQARCVVRGSKPRARVADRWGRRRDLRPQFRDPALVQGEDGDWWVLGARPSDLQPRSRQYPSRRRVCATAQTLALSCSTLNGS